MLCVSWNSVSSSLEGEYCWRTTGTSSWYSSSPLLELMCTDFKDYIPLTYMFSSSNSFTCWIIWMLLNSGVCFGSYFLLDILGIWIKLFFD